MAAQNVYDEWEREVMERGKALGLDEGKALGLDEGRALGLDEGKRAVVLRLLGVRFGLLPPSVEQRVKEASAGEFDAWAERVITAGSLEDVFKQ